MTSSDAGRPPDELVERTASARVPTVWGDFRCVSYANASDGETHLAFVAGEVDTGEPVLVRVHSECVTGDVFGSVKCDCGPQLREAMRLVAGSGRGVVVYLRGHEGRGIGISHKLLAYELQERGLDTVDANVALGLPVDHREYRIGAHILADLGVRRIRLLTNNPAKYDGLEAFGLAIDERVPLHLPAHPESIGYLRTKRDRLGHLLPEDLDAGDAGSVAARSADR